MRLPAAPEDHLPLAPHDFHILLSLVDQSLHGYAIIQEISRRTDGALTLGTSTLYAAIKRMVEAGLIAETVKPAHVESDDSRRRYYGATPVGVSVARAEALRIRQLDQIVRRSHVFDRMR